MNVFYRVTDSTVNDRLSAEFVLPDHDEFRELSSKTNYIRISSFALEFCHTIDTLVANHLGAILSKPNLIIDVRGNGGGGDRAYQALLPFVMDHKVTISPVGMSIYCAPDIIKYYKDTRYADCETKADSEGDDATIAMMEAHVGSWSPRELDTISADTVFKSIKKVAIIADRWCASATEGFIQKATQQARVTLYGEHTWGMFTYGDWMKIQMPCLPVYFSSGTKKFYNLGDEDRESVGIAPSVNLDARYPENWVRMVQRDIEK